jgi:tRNA threonylcarbamoyladenosine biosynthesis protein TsaE
LGALLFDGAVVLLHGDLGAGKTTFAQAVAAGLGVRGAVPSPTFVLVAEYGDGRLPLHHADLYRVGSEAELSALALDERVGRVGAWIVEWPGRSPWWPSDRLDVSIEGTGDARRLHAHATGPRHQPLEAAWD